MTNTIYAKRLPDLECYTAPEPSPEQIANAVAKGFDPYERLGTGITDLSKTQTLTACAVLHDILYIKGGSEIECHGANWAFDRDCQIVAKASGDSDEILKAYLFAEIVYLLGPPRWHLEDRNTPETWEQEKANGVIAQRWINACARKIGVNAPYLEADFGQYLGI